MIPCLTNGILSSDLQLTDYRTMDRYSIADLIRNLLREVKPTMEIDECTIDAMQEASNDDLAELFARAQVCCTHR